MKRLGLDQLAATDPIDPVSITRISGELHEAKSAGAESQPMELDKAVKTIQMTYFDTLLQQKDVLAKKLKNKVHHSRFREQHLALVDRRTKIMKDIQDLQFASEDASLELAPTLESKLNVLRDFGYVTRDKGTLTLKGIAAAEVTNTDELTLCESVFDGVFMELEPEEIVGVCSAFVFPEKAWSPEEIVDATPSLAKARKRVDEIHYDLEKKQNEYRVPC